MSLHRSILRNLLKTPMSLADLHIATQVSLPTLNRAMRILTESHWIRVVGQAEANGGRPAMLFGMDNRAYVIIGLHLQLPGMRLITSDLNGQVLDESEIFHGIVPAPGESVGAVADYLTHIRAAFPDRRILGVGIAAPGFIDLNTGDIIAIGRAPVWENFPICRRVQHVAGAPVFIANDVDCMAFAEFQYAGESLDKNLAYVGYDEGVKVSLFFKGELYKGSLGNTGLIASHLLNVSDQPDLQEARSLLTIIGVNQVFERRMNELDLIGRSSYANILATSNYRERFCLILNHAQDEKSICYTIVQEMNRALSAAIANVIHIVQPDDVVIGGLLSSMPKGLFVNLEAAIRNHLPVLINNNSIIQQGKLASQNSAAIGATHHFLQDYISDPTIDLV